MAYGYESYKLTHIKAKRDGIEEKARAYGGYQPTDADSLNPDLDRAPESYVADTKNQATRERASQDFRLWVADAKNACSRITTQLDKPRAPLGQYFNATDENQCYDLLTKSPQEQYREQEASAGRSSAVEDKVRNAERDLEDRKLARYNTYLAMAQAHPQIAGPLS